MGGIALCTRFTGGTQTISDTGRRRPPIGRQFAYGRNPQH